MEERQWLLGEDLAEQDDILDPITFDEVIMSLHANGGEISEKSVKKLMKEIVDIRMQDAMFLLNKNMATIIDRALGDRLLKMSFKDGTLNREVVRRRIARTDKKLVYTFGLENGLRVHEDPESYRKSISKEEALKIVNEEAVLNVTEEDDCIHLNVFSAGEEWRKA